LNPHQNHLTPKLIKQVGVGSTCVSQYSLLEAKILPLHGGGPCAVDGM
jgi:hypothetical protein